MKNDPTAGQAVFIEGSASRISHEKFNLNSLQLNPLHPDGKRINLMDFGKKLSDFFPAWKTIACMVLGMGDLKDRDDPRNKLISYEEYQLRLNQAEGYKQRMICEWALSSSTAGILGEIFKRIASEGATRLESRAIQFLESNPDYTQFRNNWFEPNEARGQIIIDLIRKRALPVLKALEENWANKSEVGHDDIIIKSRCCTLGAGVDSSPKELN